MRFFLLAAATMLLVVDLTAIAQEKDRQFIIPFDVLGPKEKLAKVKVIKLQGKATFAGLPNVNDITMAWDLTGSLKYEEIHKSGKRHTTVLTNDSGWTWTRTKDGETSTTPAKNPVFFWSMAASSLLVLKDEGFTITVGDELVVNKRSYFSAKVSRNGRPDMLLYFDKQTKWLAKASMKCEFKETPGPGWQPKGPETQVDFYFSGHKSQDGFLFWRQVVQARDNQPYSALQLSSVSTPPKVDVNFFKLPQE